MNLMIISDSFKGTLSSEKISSLFEESFNKYFKNSNLLKVKIADGGEGTIDAIKDYLNGELINLEVSGPHFEKVNSKYLLAKDVAVMEVASCASLSLAEPNLNPGITTTYGIGEQIKDAINKGVKRIIIGLGGSSTNDAGCGALSAMGLKFYDKSDKEFIPTGITLKNISRIDDKSLIELTKDVSFTLMSDCINVAYGEMGASYTFAPQKGADKNMVIELDSNIKYFCDFIKVNFNKDFSNTPGTGAAGAFGLGVLSFLNSKIESGINTLLDIINFDSLLDQVDLVFTGEGKIDSQSLNGKVINGILNRTIKKNKPVVIVAGSVDKSVENIDKNQYLIKGIFSTNRLAVDYSISKFDQEENYKNTIDSILCLLSVNNK